MRRKQLEPYLPKPTNLSAMTQQVHKSLATAAEAAIDLSKEFGYAAIVLSNGEYYVETATVFVRINEELIGEYENGELLN